MHVSPPRISIIAAACLSAGYLARLWQESLPENPEASAMPPAVPSGRSPAIVVRGAEEQGVKKTSAPDASGGAPKISPDELAVILGSVRSLPEGINRFWRLNELLRDLLKQHPDAVIDWCRKSQFGDNMIADLLGIWGEEDPAGCAQWLSQRKSSSERDTLIRHFLRGALHEGRLLDGAWTWVRAISDPAARADAAIILGGVEIWEDRGTAELELLGLGLPAELTSAIREKWKQEAKARVQRDAQNIVSIYQSARSSGASIKAGSAEEVVKILMEGVAVNDPSSPFHGKRFALHPISEARLPHSLRHVRWSDNGDLDYVQNPEE